MRGQSVPIAGHQGARQGCVAVELACRVAGVVDLGVQRLPAISADAPARRSRWNWQGRRHVPRAGEPQGNPTGEDQQQLTQDDGRGCRKPAHTPSGARLAGKKISLALVLRSVQPVARRQSRRPARRPRVRASNQNWVRPTPKVSGRLGPIDPFCGAWPLLWAALGRPVRVPSRERSGALGPGSAGRQRAVQRGSRPGPTGRYRRRCWAATRAPKRAKPVCAGKELRRRPVAERNGSQPPTGTGRGVECHGREGATVEAAV